MQLFNYHGPETTLLAPITNLRNDLRSCCHDATENAAGFYETASHAMFNDLFL